MTSPQKAKVRGMRGDRKCEPYFGRYRGCNVCIKVCATALRKEGSLSG